MGGCDISKGKNQPCKNAVSGIKAMYMANFNEYGFTTSSTTAGHILSDLGTLTEVFKFELKNSGNTFQQDINSSRENGTTFFNQVLNFTLTKLSEEMEFQVKMMAWGRPQIFIELNSGQVLLLGMEHGCEISGNGQVQGTMDSLNGYQLTATGMEKEPAFYLDTTSIAALKVLQSATNVAG